MANLSIVARKVRVRYRPGAWWSTSPSTSRGSSTSSPQIQRANHWVFCRLTRFGDSIANGQEINQLTQEG